MSLDIAALWATLDKPKIALVAASAIGTGWIYLGLPLPATQAFVGEKVARVERQLEAQGNSTERKLDGLTMSTLELQRESITGRRQRHRYELQAIAGTRSLDPTQRAILKRRADDIRDELVVLDRRDEELRLRIEALRHGAAPAGS